MADFVRRLVSGNKARYKDGDLDLELDLAYITDRVIVMGYPAVGFEGMYRNRREDAKKFLQHRHGNNYWVFNFCPTKENSYSADVFDGRVSRYPFPDHHAPPLAILPLVAREMRVWLDGSPERVAVLHCKAGKGRSGTMACSYLLSLADAPSPPTSGGKRTKKEHAKLRAEELMNTMPTDDNVETDLRAERVDHKADDPIKAELANVASEASSVQSISPAPSPSSSNGHSAKNSLSHVLELHTQGRMQRSTSPNKKPKQGVSIPSQRRWLYYWSLLLAHQGPSGFWPLEADVRVHPSPKVRLTHMSVRMRELSGVKTGLVRVANAVIDRTSLAKATHLRVSTVKNTQSLVWVSLARYDDDFVEELEKWEKRTRSEDGDFGKRNPGSEHVEGGDLGNLFKSDTWDKGKMVRSFARLGTHDEDSVTEESTKDGKIITHLLRPLTGENWELLRNDIETTDGNTKVPAKDGIASEEASLYDATRKLQNDSGVVVDANREVRAKLYMGQVFMGWFWFIPTFHMPPRDAEQQTVTLKLTRQEVDFAVGIGSHIVDLEVNLEWCSESADIISPPERTTSVESREGKGEPAGVAAAVEAVASAGTVGEIVEAKQAAED
ncbi:Telomerase protein component 1 [Steccherinum ochraceum]|uniref:phosphatidylinositol-3,4,5-trisphosphate 3-phosphatase n=1 Tax=Steccherinum ochraceum TaxID=92696 RepID=A0A4V2MX46_9APHY|nr:Telomerase protein component 1 [Steccherinum ochraceum]